MVKAKKDRGFNYLLSHKAISKSSEEKRYIRTLTFSFKVHEKSTVQVGWKG
jgi:hypothetical protein